jgi:STE24 endopeptidase
MLVLHLAFVVFLVGTEAFFTVLSVLNLRHGSRMIDAERTWLTDVLGVDDPTELIDYNRARVGISQLEGWVGLGGVLLVLYAGLYADAVRFVESTGLPPVARGVLFFLGALTVLRVVGLPFDAVGTFVVEELFDFNRQSVGSWLRDQVTGYLLSVVFAAAVGALLLLTIARLPDWWWLAGWLLFVALSLAMQVVYPRVVAPLFNDFEPVDAGDLRTAVEAVFDRAGFSCEQVYVMDASRRSSRVNAYFVGFGRTKRVVLFDTLVERLSTPELQSVLAHELAHWKKAHVWKRLAGSAVRLLAGFVVLWLLVSGDWLYRLFDVPVGTDYAGLLLAALLVQPLLRLSSPLVNRLSLAHEREADAFAVSVMGDSEPMADALGQLTAENLGNPFPHPLYAAFHYSHPPVPERIRYIRDLSTDGSRDAPSAD